uniref:Putative tick kunitz 1 n=1 Tax=Amblyomma triste TaxID=251400 RepID=A0A023GMZ6_AMBTT
MRPAVVILFLGLLAPAVLLQKSAPNENCIFRPNISSCQGRRKGWFYNGTTYRCEPYPQTLCKRDDGKILSLQKCKTQCRDPMLETCALPPPDNRCRSLTQAYRFNPDKARCELHDHCDNLNANHFKTVEDCQNKCGQFAVDPCRLPKDSGRKCKTAEPQENFWFDGEKCATFNYSGCGGNGNNFNFEQECWQTCGNLVQDSCTFPIYKGSESCARNLGHDVFGFNHRTNRCERFYYNGCGGFPNRFSNASECWKTCGKNSGSKCVETGPKNMVGILKRYYYDIKSDKCRWSLFGPDAFSTRKNKFKTKALCEETCKGDYIESASSSLG